MPYGERGIFSKKIMTPIPTLTSSLILCLLLLSGRCCSLSLETSRVSTRRSALAFGLSIVGTKIAWADEDVDTVLLRGTATLRQDAVLPEDLTSSALYITARPARPDNVPRAILDGSTGKSPPVLIARLADVKEFPVQFSLTQKDVAVEGDWWFQDDLVVSARLDSDGVAATRDPNDLVGRGFYKRGEESVSVELQGRGIGGKFITRKK